VEAPNGRTVALLSLKTKNLLVHFAKSYPPTPWSRNLPPARTQWQPSPRREHVLRPGLTWLGNNIARHWSIGPPFPASVQEFAHSLSHTLFYVRVLR
jgi:hypothetical protein